MRSKRYFSKARNRVALLALFIILAVVSVLTINRVEYVNENGNHSTGIAAAQKLRAEKNQWAGYLTEDVFRSVYRERKAINSEMAGDSIEEENKAYHHIQATESIADLINSANSPWREYDYFAVENITEDEAAKVYEKRISGLEEWMNSGEEEFTDAEKEFLTDQYESLDTPFYYEDFDGWNCPFAEPSHLSHDSGAFRRIFCVRHFSDEFRRRQTLCFSPQSWEEPGDLVKNRSGIFDFHRVLCGFCGSAYGHCASGSGGGRRRVSGSVSVLEKLL